MKAKSNTHTSFFQDLLDKYIYYVVINKNHRQSYKDYFKAEMNQSIGNLSQA